MTELPLQGKVGAVLFLECAHATKEISLASPFMTLGVVKQICDAMNGRPPAMLRILTRVEPDLVAGGFMTLDGLRLLIETGFEVRTLQQLHAKVYIIDEMTIVGSANLTASGLNLHTREGLNNVEMSLATTGHFVDETRWWFDAQWDQADPVDIEYLDEVAKKARQVPVKFGASESKKTASGKLDRLVADAQNSSLWVKAVYGAADGDWEDNAWISSSARGRPSFERGDLVLMYGKEQHRCTSIVEVSEPPVWSPKTLLESAYTPENAQRWPWVTYVEPRLVAESRFWVEPQVLGFTAKGLQGGHRRLSLSEFSLAIRYLTGNADIP